MKPTDIIFKATRTDNGQLVKGHYTHGSEQYHYITNPDGSVFEIIPETLCIGFKDKDGNIFWVSEYSLEKSTIIGGNGEPQKITDFITITAYAE